MTRLIKKVRFFTLLTLAVILVLLAVQGPALAPGDPYRIDLLNSLSRPNAGNLFGTDQLGRDLLSRTLHGARNSFVLTMVMVLTVTCVGSVIGTVAGFAGGVTDTIAMQVTDMLLAFPSVVFVIAVAGILGPGIHHTILALAVICWAKYARTARNLVADVRSRVYITQARFGGSRRRQILGKYILPNILPHIAILSTQDIGEMMITLSALSFLGLTGQPPAPEWGRMLSENRMYITTYPHLVFIPMLAMLLYVVVFNLLGDSLRDMLDPKES